MPSTKRLTRPFTSSIGRVVASLLLLATAVIALPAPSEAITSHLWVQRGPLNVRFRGIDMNPTGQVAYAVNDLGTEGGLNNLSVGRVWTTIDRGQTWATVAASPMGAWQSVAMSDDGTTIVIAGQLNTGTGASPTLSAAVFISTNSATTWTEVTPNNGATSYPDVSITPDGSTIAVASSAGVLTSVNDGGTWDPHPALSGSVVAVGIGSGSDGVVIHAGYSAVVSSTLLTSTSAVTSLTGLTGIINDLATSNDGRAVIVGVRDGASGGATHVSLDAGATWTTRSQPGFATGQTVTVAVAGDGNSFTAASYNSKLQRSTDGGATWSEFDRPSESRGWLALAMSFDTSVVMGGVENGRIRTATATPPPSLNQDQHLHAPSAGGGQFTLWGTNLYDVQSITFGGRPATSISASVDGSTISARFPVNNPAGLVDVVVTTLYGSATLSSGVNFYQLGAPTVTSLSSSDVPYIGGEEITITGTGMREVESIRIGDVDVSDFFAPSDTSLTFIAPLNRIGVMDVRLDGSQGSLTLPGAWNSRWVTTSGTPRWRSLDGRHEPALGYDPENHVSALSQGPDGAIYVGGHFENFAGIATADHIVRWDGSTWSALGSDGQGDGALAATTSAGVFSRKGVLDIEVDGEGNVWAGGAFANEFGSTVGEGHLARWNSSSGWSSVSAGPDGPVQTMTWSAGNGLFVGGGFDHVGGVSTSAVALLNNNGWQPVQQSGVTLSAGAYSDFRSNRPWVLSLATASNGELLVGGSFRAPALSNPDAPLLRWSNGQWMPRLGAGVWSPMAIFDVEVATINGQVVTLIAASAVGTDGSGYVFDVSNPSTPVPLGVFDGYVLDVEVVAGHVVAGGFLRIPRPNTQITGRGAALLTDDGWIDLGVRTPVSTLLGIDNERLIVGGFGSAIGGHPGARGVGISSSLLPFLGVTTSVSIASVSPSSLSSSGGQTVTIVGSGFTRDTEVTYGGRPAPNLQFVSSTELRFTSASVNPGSSTITVYGDVDTASTSITVTSPPVFVPAPIEPTTTTTPSTTVPRPSDDDESSDSDTPSIELIANLPMAQLISGSSRLVPGGPIDVSTDGFAPGERVSIVLASTLRLIGTAIADGDGRVRTIARLPIDIVGEHTLVVWSPSTNRGLRQPIVVAAPILPITGDSSPVWPALSLMVLGAFVLAITRRTRTR